MSVEELIDNLAIKVEGPGGEGDNVLIFTLSTCQWCKKCKRFLEERKMKYRYIEVDKIEHKDKLAILNYLEAKYNSRISYPFLVCEKGFAVGYNPNKYMELFNTGED